MSHSPYEVREVSVTARPVAGVRAQVQRGRVGQEFGRHLDQVYAAGRIGAVKLDGQNIFIYRSATKDELKLVKISAWASPRRSIRSVPCSRSKHRAGSLR